MEVAFTKLSVDRHRVCVERADGSVERREFESRSFLRHDLVHFAVEAELGLRHGYWGSVAAGRSLDGAGITSDDITLAERLVGPLQTLTRSEHTPGDVEHTLSTVAPGEVDRDAAARIHERLRRLLGHWRATAFQGDMRLRWPPEPLRS